MKETLLYAPLGGGGEIGNEKTVAQLLQSGDYKYVHTVQDDKYGPVAVYSRQADHDRTYTLSFSLRYSYTIVRSEIRNTRFRRTYDVEDVQQIGNLYFPKVVSVEHVLLEPNGTSSVFTTEVTSLDTVSFEAPDASLFDMHLKPKDIVKDNMTGEIWTVGPHGEKIHNMEKSTVSQNTMYFGWLYMASITTLLVLTVGAYIRWKRKQLAELA